MARIFVLGSGGFGTALAVMAHKYGQQVTLWAAFQEEIDEIRFYGENKKKLPGVAVGLAQGGIHLRTQQVRVQSIKGRRCQQRLVILYRLLPRTVCAHCVKRPGGGAVFTVRWPLAEEGGEEA